MPRHPFHVVEPRPWPIIAALNAFNLATGLLIWFYEHTPKLVVISVVAIMYTLTLWWRDVVRERTFLGHHTSYVCRGLRIGIVLFLISEAIFFVGFFWAFFHTALSPGPEIGCIWPPIGIKIPNPYTVPLFNTVTLLSSGVTVTWAHHRLLEGSRDNALAGLALTIALGITFTFTQMHEYYHAHFTIADGIFGSIFFVATGFHGLHVIIGTIFLSVNLFRTYCHHFSPGHHLGFEFGAWYWHFVDVVWIFLYLFLYCYSAWGA